MASSPTSLVFKVHRHEPELITPAKPTPRECKLLSDIDDQDAYRSQTRLIQIYRNNPSMQGIDPVRVIREALAQTLVFYYPLAGRIREGPGRKLMVDCTGEGVMFIEADADVTQEQFGDHLHPPFPCINELLFDVPGSAGTLDGPLFHVQVTRLRCGGFIFAYYINHTICDAIGVAQFMRAIGEMARGWLAPLILPAWERHLLSARNPPRVTCKHREYEQVERTLVPNEDMAQRSFFFGPTEISTLRKLVPQHHLRRCSTFELLAACLWRCHTIAIQVNPKEEVRFMCPVNTRSKMNPPLPSGYYGNAIANPVVVTQAGKICENPLGYALELVKQLKGVVTEEYVRSLADLMVIKGRPHLTFDRTYTISNGMHIEFGDIDFGWGKPMYAGVASGSPVGSYLVPFKNKIKGVVGILVPIILPAKAMEIFANELDGMLKGKRIDGSCERRSNSISSFL